MAPATPAQSGQEKHEAQRLGPFLCWAVVFADIGTSIYYVPGILYGTVGKLTGFFVLLTMTVFILTSRHWPPDGVSRIEHYAVDYPRYPCPAWHSQLGRSQRKRQSEHGGGRHRLFQ